MTKPTVRKYSKSNDVKQPSINKTSGETSVEVKLWFHDFEQVVEEMLVEMTFSGDYRKIDRTKFIQNLVLFEVYELCKREGRNPRTVHKVDVGSYRYKSTSIN